MFFTPKIEAIVTGAVAGVTGFIGWLVTVPPDVQSGIIGLLLGAVPVEWRANLGVLAKGLSAVSGIWAIYQASHSGPPPVNPATAGPSPTLRDATMGAEGNQAIRPQGASIPPLGISKTLAVILAAALALSGCASLTPSQRPTGAKIWTDVANVAEVGGTAAAGYYGGPTGQAVASALFSAANDASAGKPVNAQTVSSVVTAAGGEPALATLAAAELDKSGALTPKQTALVVNTIGAAVQQVANAQAR